MPLIVQCAWCGAVVATKNNPQTGDLSVSHTVCVSCKAKVSGLWDGVERRGGFDRRQRESRIPGPHPLEKLVIIDGVVWLETTGRRAMVRRRSDRDVLSARLNAYQV